MNFKIDNLQYCNWSREIFEINREAKLDAVHVTIVYHEDFDELQNVIKSDYKTLTFTHNILKSRVVVFETKIISAYRTPNRLYQFATVATKHNIGLIISGAGGSAHLPGMIAALTHLPVLGVPIESKKLKGLDSLLSISQMPKGIPVGTLAIGEDGATNAALLAASIIGNTSLKVKNKLKGWRLSQTKSVKKIPK